MGIMYELTGGPYGTAAGTPKAYEKAGEHRNSQIDLAISDQIGVN